MFFIYLSFPALADIRQVFQNFPVIIFLSFSDLRARYKRSVLGPFWLTLSTALGSAGLGFLWSELMKVDFKTFVPTLTAGLILWQFISGLILESTSVYSRQASIVRNINLPLAIYPVQLMFRHLINLAHTAPVFFAVALYLGLDFNMNSWFAIPCVLLVILNLLWVALLFGLLGARFRDLEYFISSIMPLLMLVSPVFYRPNFFPFSENIIWLNPFSHFIEIVRYPLLGYAPPLFVVKTNLALLAGGWLATLWLFNRTHHRIAFWI
jgi:ABC-type polysaccharide/polyol phosphate export permease